MLFRTIHRTNRSQIRTFFTPRDDYKTGEGIRSKEQVFGEKPPENPEDYTITGRKKGAYFHYTDRKSGQGYTDFNHNPFIHRPYVWPPIRQNFKIAPYIFAVLISPFFVDYQWVWFHIRQWINHFFPEFEDFYNDRTRSYRDLDYADRQNK